MRHFFNLLDYHSAVAAIQKLGAAASNQDGSTQESSDTDEVHGLISLAAQLAFEVWTGLNINNDTLVNIVWMCEPLVHALDILVKLL